MLIKYEKSREVEFLSVIKLWIIGTNLNIVSISIPEKPKAESPSTQITLFSGWYWWQYNWEAIAKPKPTPIVPKVPTNKKIYWKIINIQYFDIRINWRMEYISPASNLCRGKLFSNIVRPMSMVLAPSLTMTLSRYMPFIINKEYDEMLYLH